MDPEPEYLTFGSGEEARSLVVTMSFTLFHTLPYDCSRFVQECQTLVDTLGGCFGDLAECAHFLEVENVSDDKSKWPGPFLKHWCMSKSTV